LQFGEVVIEQGWQAEFRTRVRVLNLEYPSTTTPCTYGFGFARAQQRVAAKYDDQELCALGELLEERAIQAIRAGKDSLDPLN
jgi:hypothetical protein